MSNDKKDHFYTPKKTPKYFISTFIATVIVCMILWPLFDLIWSKITNSPYEGWTVWRGVAEPSIFAAIAMIIEILFFDKIHKNRKK